MSETCRELERRLEYRFRTESLLELALTHRSFGGDSNERLEYLGDAILNFVVAERLYRDLPAAAEGALTRLRASLVKKETLAEISREINLGEYLHLGGGERKSGGWRRDSILANTLEAVIGAIYLDSGLGECSRTVELLFGDRFHDLSLKHPGKDPKTALQEILQARKQALPAYRVIAEDGEAHERSFTVECSIELLAEPVVASGRSKRIAEQAAAGKALDLITAAAADRGS